MRRAQPGLLRSGRVSPARLADYRLEVGEILAAYRVAAGMTQQQLAARISYSRSAVACVETGRQVAAMDFWQAADRVLHAGGVLRKAAVHLADLGRALAAQTARDQATASTLMHCADPDRCACAVVVARWTGRETHALRQALRMGLAEFARAVNVSTTTAVAWERPPSPPHLSAQHALDRVLSQAAPDARARFQLLRGGHGQHE